MSEDLTTKTEELSLENNKTVFDSKENFNSKHPLNNKWTLWYTKPQTNKSEQWHELLKPVITFASVEEFWGIYNSIPQANQLPLKSDYHLFKEGIRPEWEDDQNSKGGKFQYSFNKKEVQSIISDLWLRGLLALIGETIEEEENLVNGIVLNVRKSNIRIGLWVANVQDLDSLKSIGEKLKKILQLNENSKLELTSHDEKIKDPLLVV
ncbi:unnamed protein product [Candida verbasci]|uniref:Eukaryotic translation initiation factor 4E n=1 Tax=Candida verbasci TaxID=1227364 RepID=A0A9W4XBM7_9ASCO|nr:unnamed protein product [Candida verbasci]